MDGLGCGGKQVRSRSQSQSQVTLLHHEHTRPKFQGPCFDICEDGSLILCSVFLRFALTSKNGGRRVCAPQSTVECFSGILRLC